MREPLAPREVVPSADAADEAMDDLYRALFEESVDGVLLVRADGRILRANASFCRMMSRTEDEIRRGGRSSLVVADEALARLLERRKGEGRASGELTIKRPDGSTVAAYVTSGALGDPGSGHAYVMIREVSEQRRTLETMLAEHARLEAAVQQKQKLESLGLLAGGIAHDFNNLLTVVTANASVARGQLGPESPLRELVDEITAAAAEAAGLTRQLLAYAGKAEVVISDLSLSDLVADMGRLIGLSVPKKCTLVLDGAREPAPVRGDATQLRQVAMNLVMNAAEALPEHGGKVIVRTGTTTCDRAYLARGVLADELPEGRYAWLEVEDDGSGMAPEVVARMFDPFFSTKAKGRGLGLPTVLGIVRAHHGTLRIDTAPGRGTTVRVLVPAAGDAAPRSARPDVPVPRARRSTVLVIDDDAGVRSVSRRILQQAGHDVLVAADGSEGVAAFAARAGDVDLVLLDMTMPGLDGLEVFARLERIRPGARVVLCSGHGDPDAASRFRPGALAGVLRKPFTADELLAATSEALAAARPS